MANELIYSVLLTGKHFSPGEFEDETGLQLSEKLEVGEMVKRGRFKGGPSAIGMGHCQHQITFLLRTVLIGFWVF